MMQAVDSDNELEILKRRTRLDLSVNDLRILLGCFKAVAYQADVDDEPYLDADAVDLSGRLESAYSKLLKQHGLSQISD
jgi:hypothetical protein